jgi:hypothetical protein
MFANVPDVIRHRMARIKKHDTTPELVARRIGMEHFFAGPPPARTNWPEESPETDESL